VAPALNVERGEIETGDGASFGEVPHRINDVAIHLLWNLLGQPAKIRFNPDRCDQSRLEQSVLQVNIAYGWVLAIEAHQKRRQHCVSNSESCGVESERDPRVNAAVKASVRREGIRPEQDRNEIPVGDQLNLCADDRSSPEIDTLVVQGGIAGLD